MIKHYYTIFIDGIDKTGKDTICTYIDQLSGHNYVVKPRGVISQIAYSDIYGRDQEYDLEQQKDIVNVLLTVDKDDWEVRCRMTNETKIDYREHSQAFLNAAEIVEKVSKVFTYNTTYETPFEIAEDILAKVEKLEILNDKTAK